MAIIATNNGGGNYAPIEAGNYPARCFQMIQIGTVEESFQGKVKRLNKVRLTWELPTELKEWKEGDGEKPAVISKEFNLFMNDTSNLRKFLASWRGKDFTEEESKAFDITVLTGKPCLLNIIHETSKDGSKVYAKIGSIAPLPKGMICDPQINKSLVLSYDDFDHEIFETLPDFIKDKMKGSDEYKAMSHPHETQVTTEIEDDGLPF